MHDIVVYSLKGRLVLRAAAPAGMVTVKDAKTGKFKRYEPPTYYDAQKRMAIKGRRIQSDGH